MNDNNSKRITILTPVYNEEECLTIYKERVKDILLSHKEYCFNILLIDDGSTDKSWEHICDICSDNPMFNGIRLSRNYGSHIALSAGFSNINDSDAVATLACDLQDPPETIIEFINKWEQGAQIVWGHRKKRSDNKWRILTSKLFFYLIRRFAMPIDSKFATGSFFLIDKKVANCFVQFQETNRITFALVAWTGFKQDIVEYDRQQRIGGTSGWNFNKMIKTMYDTFLGFSFLPIRLITIIGMILFFLTFLFAGYIFINWLSGNPLKGWTSLMLVMTTISGIHFLLMGITGEYLYRIYSEVVRRPLYFISDKIGKI